MTLANIRDRIGLPGSWMPFGGVLAVLVLGACLIFISLGDRALWDDEAQTAILGRQVLQYGLPMMQPGENIPTDRADKADFNGRSVFIWNTWLPHYLVAASFGVLGESELAARLPFALTGLCTVILVVLVARRMYPDDPWYPLLAGSLLILSVPFLLHVRQCRYYAPVIAGTLWMVYGYVSRGKGLRAGWYHIAAGGVLCFYSFHISAAINGLALLLHALWRRDVRMVRDLFACALVIVALASPAIIYMQLWSLPRAGDLVSASTIDAFWVFLLWVNGFIVPFPVALLAGYLRQVRGWRVWVGAYALFLAGAVTTSLAASAVFSALFVAAVMAAIVLAHPRSLTWRRISSDDEEIATASASPGELLVFFAVVYVVLFTGLSQYPFYRYLVPLVPLAALFSGRVIRDLMMSSRPLAVVVFLLLVASNVLSAVPLASVDRLSMQEDRPRQRYSVVPRETWRWTPVRFDLVPYLGELRNTMVDPERCLAKAIGQSGRNGEIIKTSWGDLSLMYYFPAKRIISRHVVGDVVPDIVIRRDPYPLMQDASFLERVQRIPYVAVELPCPNVIWSSNPDPLFHLYRLPADAPRLTMYRKQDLQ